MPYREEAPEHGPDPDTPVTIPAQEYALLCRDRLILDHLDDSSLISFDDCFREQRVEIWRHRHETYLSGYVEHPYLVGFGKTFRCSVEDAFDLPPVVPEVPAPEEDPYPKLLLRHCFVSLWAWVVTAVLIGVILTG